MLFERLAITRSQAIQHLSTVAASVQSQNPIQLPTETNQPIPLPVGIISSTGFQPQPFAISLPNNPVPGGAGGGSQSLPLQGVNVSVNGKPATQQLSGQPPQVLP